MCFYEKIFQLNMTYKKHFTKAYNANKIVDSYPFLSKKLF